MLRLKHTYSLYKRATEHDFSPPTDSTIFVLTNFFVKWEHYHDFPPYVFVHKIKLIALKKIKMSSNLANQINMYEQIEYFVYVFPHPQT